MEVGEMSWSYDSPASLHDLIYRISTEIDSGIAVSNKKLIEYCREYCGFDSATDSHFYHEVAEAALNLLILRKYGHKLLGSKEVVESVSSYLRPLQKRLPTQTWRSETQITYQQFSTPAPIAFLAAYLLNIGPNDCVLEPSCGTGSLAVWAKAAGASVVTNEIDPRRRDLARCIGFDPTAYDAEFIDDLLPEFVVPNVVLMNPPFSSTGGRMKNNQSKFGFRHVQSALRRLADGGRFAVILGEAGSPSSLSGKRFWDSISPDIEVTRSISLSGREYYRNGTTVGVTLMFGHKSKANDPLRDALPPKRQSFESVEHALEAIQQE